MLVFRVVCTVRNEDTLAAARACNTSLDAQGYVTRCRAEDELDTVSQDTREGLTVEGFVFDDEEITPPSSRVSQNLDFLV